MASRLLAQIIRELDLLDVGSGDDEDVDQVQARLIQRADQKTGG